MGQTCFNFTVENDAALEDSLECLVVRIELPENASDLLRIAPGNDSTLCCIVDDDSELAISQFRHKKYFFFLCMSKWMVTSHDINISAFLHSPSVHPLFPLPPFLSSIPPYPLLSSSFRHHYWVYTWLLPGGWECWESGSQCFFDHWAAAETYRGLIHGHQRNCLQYVCCANTLHL